MAERNQKVYERVRQELSKNPSIGSRELYGVAQTVDKAIAQDSMQQFHARYYLPVKREMRPGGESAPRAAAPATAKRGRRPKKEKTREAAAAPAEAPAQRSSGAQPVKRMTRRRRGIEQGAQRDQVRALLIQFAQELTDAESRSTLVQVLGKVDTYVDKIASTGR
jgi:hypothetical protein